VCHVAVGDELGGILTPATLGVITQIGPTQR
jgi:hypothetical protein